MRWAHVVVGLGGLLGGCAGSCPEGDPVELRSGIYGMHADDVAGEVLGARQDPDDTVVVRFDRQAGTLSVSFVDEDGGERLAEYTVGAIEVGYH